MNIRSKPSSCAGCACEKHGSDFSEIEGTGANGILVVAEASGEHEQREQLPLRPYARAGSIFERILRRMSLDRQQFSVTNVLRCFGGDTLVRASGIQKIYRRSYSGPVIRIKTNLGELTGTPNHPVLTHRGMVPLKQLTKGDCLVHDPEGERLRSLEPDIHYGPTKFDELYRTLSDRWRRERATCGPIDFHGDGLYGDVDIVSKYGELRHWPESFPPELAEELSLQLANNPSAMLFLASTCHGTSDFFIKRNLSTAHRSMGCIRDSTSSSGSHSSESDNVGLGAIADVDASFSKSLLNGPMTDVQLFTEGLNPLSSKIAFADVIDIEYRSWSGHVYDLETSIGIYTADGFIVSNCRPRNNWLENAPWEYSAITSCRPNLDAAIAARKPRVIVALGNVALRELTGMAGDARGITHLAGYVLPHQRVVPVRCDECISLGDGKPEPNCFICGGTGWVPGTAPNNVGTIPVIGDYHPAFLGRGKASYQGLFARILQRAINISKGTDKNWMWDVSPTDRSTHGTLNYQTHPSLDEARAFANRVAAGDFKVLSYDIETSESVSLDEDAREGFADTQLRLIQFSGGGCGAIALPWEGAYKLLAREILLSPVAKCGHNVWLFDNKVLKAAGEREGLDLNPRGTIHDTLQMFHHWQPDLPAHLQAASQFVQFPFPWKHLAGTDLEFYGCCDVDATLRLYNMLEATLKRDGLWGDSVRGYIGQVHDVRPVLEKMEDRGVPIDDAARLKLDAEFEQAQIDLGVEISKLAPESCQRKHPKEGYKGVPPAVKEWLADHPGEDPVHVHQRRYREKDDDNEGEWFTYQRREFEVAEVDFAGQPCKTNRERWCRLYDFNPNSRGQVLDYMDAHGHKRPKDKHRETDEGENPDTTNAKELTRLAHQTGDPFYLKVVEFRGLTKMRGTYVPGFAPGPDGCVHTTFTFDTGIGQLSSRNPNVQNFPKLKPTVRLAKAMRAMIAAKPGYVLTEWDYKSCHALTLGFLAGDADYMRLTRLDVHSSVAGHMLGHWDIRKILQETDDELRARFKWLKSDAIRKVVRDDQAKHAILGIGNGLHAKGLFERYMENFVLDQCPDCTKRGEVYRKCVLCKGTNRPSGLKIAQRFLDLLEELFPKIFAYQAEEQKSAHEKMQLVSPFLHIRRFFEVYRWDNRKHAMTHGDQSEQAVSFRHPNIAFGHIREALKALDRCGAAEKYGLFNNVHDSFLFHFPAELLTEHVAEIAPILRAPSVILKSPLAPGGLVIDVEASCGPNWRDMRDLPLPPVNLNPIAVESNVA